MIEITGLTHWGRVTHICVSDLTSIGSDNGLSPGRRQAIIRTNAGILLVSPLGTNFSEILIEIQIFLLKKIRLKMSSTKCCSFRLGLNVLKGILWPVVVCSHDHLKTAFIDTASTLRIFDHDITNLIHHHHQLPVVKRSFTSLSSIVREYHMCACQVLLVDIWICPSWAIATCGSPLLLWLKTM